MHIRRHPMRRLVDNEKHRSELYEAILLPHYILTIYRQRSLLGNLVIHRNIRRDRRRMHADAAPAVQEQEQRVEICRRQCIQLERVFCTLEIQSGSVFGVERDG